MAVASTILRRANGRGLGAVFTAQDFNLNLDQSHILSLENECHWFLDSGAVSPRPFPEILPYFHLPGLLAVRPQAVQIIRAKEGGRP